MHISPAHRWVLIVGSVVFFVGALLVAGTYVVQSGWQSVETSDVTPLNQSCEAAGSSGTFYRYAYYVDGQTYYYDECRTAAPTGSGYSITYDPQDPYTASINSTDNYRIIGFILAGLGLLTTIAGQLLTGRSRHR